MEVAPFQQGKPQIPSAYHAFTCMVLAYVPLAKASHKANPRVSVGEDYIRIQMHESRIRWSSLLLQSDIGAKSGNHREQLGGSTITQREMMMDCTGVMTMEVLRSA